MSVSSILINENANIDNGKISPQFLPQKANVKGKWVRSDPFALNFGTGKDTSSWIYNTAVVPMNNSGITVTDTVPLSVIKMECILRIINGGLIVSYVNNPNYKGITPAVPQVVNIVSAVPMLQKIPCFLFLTTTSVVQFFNYSASNPFLFDLDLSNCTTYEDSTNILNYNINQAVSFTEYITIPADGSIANFKITIGVGNQYRDGTKTNNDANVPFSTNWCYGIQNVKDGTFINTNGFAENNLNTVAFAGAVPPAVGTTFSYCGQVLTTSNVF